MSQRPEASAASLGYVTLGSSFAAELGLGSRAPGSPCLCLRRINSYPQQLARMADLALIVSD